MYLESVFDDIQDIFKSVNEYIISDEMKKIQSQINWLKLCPDNQLFDKQIKQLRKVYEQRLEISLNNPSKAQHIEKKLEKALHDFHDNCVRNLEAEARRLARTEHANQGGLNTIVNRLPFRDHLTNASIEDHHDDRPLPSNLNNISEPISEETKANIIYIINQVRAHQSQLPPITPRDSVPPHQINQKKIIKFNSLLFRIFWFNILLFATFTF